MDTPTKSILFGAASALFLASASYASPAGQAFEVTGAEASHTLFFDAEGGYTKQTDEGAKVGAWTLEDEVLCLIPADDPEPRCGGWVDLEVGESTISTEWSRDGSEVTILRIE
ncbi:hypothetical protein F1654_10240 [Alkalicaulis satelles]|uniref:Uncharacterized protein n=1 Tax=Alkalicaulis satelles TaxID=2609175 RepID=A0A5M6ZDC5_9PROT|nr:hypothetical protein [Alkalicaulis satelles]KAA5802210.1 hypothetical protein F1654_10240 [Alkalicaulis satelles]